MQEIQRNKKTTSSTTNRWNIETARCRDSLPAPVGYWSHRAVIDAAQDKRVNLDLFFIKSFIFFKIFILKFKKYNLLKFNSARTRSISTRQAELGDGDETVQIAANAIIHVLHDWRFNQSHAHSHAGRFVMEVLILINFKFF